MPSLTVGAVLADAWSVYRLLFRRSISIAVVVYGAIAGLDVAAATADSRGARVAASVLDVLLSLAGPLLVQGALVKIVQNVHEAKRPESSLSLFRAAGRRLGSLLGASLIYSTGVLIGLILLVVPGLLVAARWALMAPAIMLEGRWGFPARDRSREIVRGEIENGLGDRTALALGVVVTSFLITVGIRDAFYYLSRPHLSHWGVWVASTVLATLGAPYQAHVLSVLYYRLVDPHRPAVDPRVWTWSSVWDGLPETA